MYTSCILDRIAYAQFSKYANLWNFLLKIQLSQCRHAQLPTQLDRKGISAARYLRNNPSHKPCICSLLWVTRYRHKSSHTKFSNSVHNLVKNSSAKKTHGLASWLVHQLQIRNQFLNECLSGYCIICDCLAACSSYSFLTLQQVQFQFLCYCFRGYKIISRDC